MIEGDGGGDVEETKKPLIALFEFSMVKDLYGYS